MAYLTEHQLRGFASTLKYQSTTFANVKARSADAQVTIFLSHSHKDRELAQGIIFLFASRGISVYVDWNDSDMPRVTDRKTADRLKAKIQENALFMMLATRNALESRWVPWEVGIADQAKTEYRVLVIPVADPAGRFEGNEYLQLYRRIVLSELGEILVAEPGRFTGTRVEDYLPLWGK